MKILEKTASMALVLVVIMAAPAGATHIPTVGLGTASSFAVLAATGVTNTGGSVVKGDLGSYPNNAVTGFPPGTVQNGTINPSYTAQAKDALVTAYNDAAGRAPVTTIGTELGGQTLTHGVYNSEAGTFGMTGTLTLDAQGDANAVWIFKMASTLTTASSSNVSLINGASECNVFWQVGSSATLGTSSTLRGTIMALTSITLTTSATLFGRALARDGAVTLDTNTIDASRCLTASPGGTTTTASPGGTTTTASPGGTTTTASPGGTTTTARRTTTSTTGGELPRTGERLPIGPSLALGIGLIAAGLLFNFLGSSSAKPVPAWAVRGYKPRRRARR